MPTEIEATYRVVTPMFCAGTDPTQAEVRVPSFKGVLRFWWRAHAWSRWHGNLDDIRQAEDRLFGSSGGRQSRISIGQVACHRIKRGAGCNLRGVGPGIRYLGYGVMEAGRNQREFLHPGLNFTARMSVRDAEKELDPLSLALATLGLFGGMGARSRKGFGSVSMRSLRVSGEETWGASESIDGLSNRIKYVLKKCTRADLPAYTALSNHSRCLLLTSKHNEPIQLLDAIGRELRDGIRMAHHGERIAFGLPRGRRTDRRASPLFVHIEQCAGRPVAVLTFLPAQFQRDDTQTPRGLYRPVREFLDRLARCKEPLQATEVEI